MPIAPGLYKIVLVHRAPKTTIDLPAEVANHTSGKVHKMFPNDYKG